MRSRFNKNEITKAIAVLELDRKYGDITAVSVVEDKDFFLDRLDKALRNLPVKIPVYF